MASKNTDSSEFIQYMTFNFKILLMISTTIILWSLFISCINSIRTGMGGDIIYEPVKLNGMDMICGCSDNACACRSIENFSNDEMYSYKQSASSSYQSIPLTPKDDENLFFGQANRFIMIENEPVFGGKGKIVYRLEIFCNLFVLDGNIFDQKKSLQSYGVYLSNSKTGDSKFLNNLVKENDGMYKLKFKTSEDIEKLASYDQVKIIYNLEKGEELLLSGKFH